MLFPPHVSIIFGFRMSNNVRKCKFFLRTADRSNSPLIPFLNYVGRYQTYWVKGFTRTEPLAPTKQSLWHWSCLPSLCIFCYLAGFRVLCLMLAHSCVRLVPSLTSPGHGLLPAAIIPVRSHIDMKCLLHLGPQTGTGIDCNWDVCSHCTHSPTPTLYWLSHRIFVQYFVTWKLELVNDELIISLRSIGTLSWTRQHILRSQLKMLNLWYIIIFYDM